MALETVVAANVLPSAAASIFRKKIAAGVTVTQGQPIAFDADGNLILADINGSDLAKALKGVTLTAGSPGQQCLFTDSDPDFAPGFTATLGTAYGPAETAGRLQACSNSVTGDVVMSIGVGKTNGNIALKIQALGTQS